MNGETVCSQYSILHGLNLFFFLPRASAPIVAEVKNMKVAVLIQIAALAILLIGPASSQIPTACSDANSLENAICCPDTGDGVCGQASGRGLCVSLNQPGYSNESTDVRVNWPHYFTQICQCNGNYGGYDCGRCRYGYYGSDCSQKQVLPRRPIHEYTDKEWNEFIQILRLSKTYQSDYVVILEESRSGTSNLSISNISIYNMFVWLHHFAAKDSSFPGTPRDSGMCAILIIRYIYWELISLV